MSEEIKMIACCQIDCMFVGTKSDEYRNVIREIELELFLKDEQRPQFNIQS
jgi:hypothetical protein